jgi:hypothetical protein
MLLSKSHIIYNSSKADVQNIWITRRNFNKKLVVDQVYNDENDKIWRISLLEGEKKEGISMWIDIRAYLI